MQQIPGPNLTQVRSELFELLMRRKKRAVWLSSTLLLLSLLITAVGIFIATRIENISVIGYASGIILAFGSFLTLLGLFLQENRKQLLVAAIIFLSFGVIGAFFCVIVDGVFTAINIDLRPLHAGRCQHYTSGTNFIYENYLTTLVAAIIFLSFGVIGAFFCVIVDGVFTAINIDLRPLHAGRCQHYTSGTNFIYENYLTTVPCQSLTESCNLKVRSNTCYCCDLYNCAKGDYLNNYFEFVGVKSCQEVHVVYIMIWLVTALNVSAFLLGIITSAILGSFKNMESLIGPEVSFQLFHIQSSRYKPKDQLEIQPILSPTAPLLLHEQAVDTMHQGPPTRYMAMPMAGSLPGCDFNCANKINNPPPFSPLYNLLPEKPVGYPI